MRNAIILLILVGFTSCVSTKSTIQNVDNNAPIPKLTTNNAFILSDYSTDKRYGFDPDYPVNVFFRSSNNETINQERYLRALAGPKGEEISFKKVESCCPFPTKRTEIGAGFLDIYEITWNGNQTPVKMYLNMYERGALLVPVGFTLKK